MIYLSDIKQVDSIATFSTTPRYLDDILSINNIYFDNMISQIYPAEPQLINVNTSDKEATFLGLAFVLF